MISDLYQVNLLRKSATRAILAADLIHRSEPRTARLRLHELAHDLRREAHELEDVVNQRIAATHQKHLETLKKENTP